MYDVPADPYCYPNTTVLKNRLGLRSQADLDAFEEDVVTQRGEEPLPTGRFTVRHYQAVHRHLFQDLFTWAGRFRTVRISKGGSMFCYPEHIPDQMRQVFERLQATSYLRGRDRHAFAAGAAHFLAELNAIHPFRDGNGRTQLAFMALLAMQAGHPLALERLDPLTFLGAMIASFSGNEQLLAEQLEHLLGEEG